MDDSAYYTIELSKIKDTYDLWKQYLPDIEVYYAMKCNPNKNILKEIDSNIINNLKQYYLPNIKPTKANFTEYEVK